MKIDHVAMYVANIYMAKAFFVKYFGGVASEAYRNPGTGFMNYFISFEDGARLELMSKGGVELIDNKIERIGYAHVSFSVGSREAVNELTERLIRDGYELVSAPRVTGDGYYESCVFDLEKNRVEITV